MFSGINYETRRAASRTLETHHFCFPHPAAAKIIDAIPTTSKAGQPKEITAINAITDTIPILTFTTGS